MPVLTIELLHQPGDLVTQRLCALNAFLIFFHLALVSGNAQSPAGNDNLVTKEEMIHGFYGMHSSAAAETG